MPQRNVNPSFVLSKAEARAFALTAYSPKPFDGVEVYALGPEHFEVTLRDADGEFITDIMVYRAGDTVVFIDF